MSGGTGLYARRIPAERATLWVRASRRDVCKHRSAWTPAGTTLSIGGGAVHQQRRSRSGKESVSLDVKRAFPFRLYGQARPGRTAPSTAVPSVLLTRKRSQVQTLSRPR